VAVAAGLQEVKPDARLLCSLRPYQVCTSFLRTKRQLLVVATAVVALLKTALRLTSFLLIVLSSCQRAALTWLLRREGRDLDVGADGTQGAASERTEGAELHPLFTEYALEDEHRTPLFFSELSGILTLRFPEASPEVSGGVLADEMGLGKTVEVILSQLSALLCCHVSRSQPAWQCLRCVCTVG